MAEENTIIIDKFKNNKYGYLKAGNTDENKITSFSVSNKNYTVSYEEIEKIYKAVAEDLKKETFEKLGLTEGDDINNIAKDINETYADMVNKIPQIQRLPELIDIAKSVKNFEQAQGEMKKGLTGKLKDSITNDPNISSLIGGYDSFITSINEAMSKGKFEDMKTLIDSTYRVISKEGNLKWEKEVGNLSGAIGEGLVFSIISDIDKQTEDIIQGKTREYKGQRALGLDTIYDSYSGKWTKQGKGDVRLLIKVKGSDVLLDFSMKTTMQDKPSTFKAAKELSLQQIQVGDDFKVDIKQLAAASLYTGKGSDGLLFRKFIASLLASYAFGGYFNRALNIIYFMKTGGGGTGPPTGKVVFRFFFQYFEEIVAQGKGSYPNLSFNKFLQKSNSLTNLIVEAKKLNTISINITGKFL